MDVDCNQFITDCAAEAARCKKGYPEERQQPDAKDVSDEVIRQAEAAKIRMLATPGNDEIFGNPNNRFNGATVNQHSSIVDESYIMVGSHLDLSLKDKIRRGST